MDEKPDEIIGHIEAQRSQLGRNLNELETRVRRSTDWRTYYDRNPMLIVGAALGGGALLGAALGPKTKHSRSSRNRYSGKSLGIGDTSKAAYSGSTSHIGGTYSPGRYDASQTESSGGSSSAGSRESSSSPAQSYYSSSARHSSSSGLTSSQSPHIKQITETLDHMKGALIAFGIARAKEFLANAVPGLEQHLHQMGGSQSSHSQQSSPGQTGNQTYGSEQRSGTGSSQGFSSSGSGSQTPGQTSARDTTSGTGTGANDYRSGSSGYNNPGSSGTQTSGSAGEQSNQFAGAGSGRNPGVNP